MQTTYCKRFRFPLVVLILAAGLSWIQESKALGRKHCKNCNEQQARIQDFGQAGPSGVLTPRGALTPKFAPNRGFKIASRLHDFEEILGARGPQAPHGSAAEQTFVVSMVVGAFPLQCGLLDPDSANFSFPGAEHSYWNELGCAGRRL